MANNRLAIDFGNSFMNVVGENKKGTVTKACIQSTYSILTSTVIKRKNTVECNGITLQLGHMSGTEFTNVNKVDREYLEHQILWAAHATMGSGVHYIKLAAGLPIKDFTGKLGKKDEWKARLESIKIIKGTVNGQEVEVHNISPVTICAEGYGALAVLTDLVPKTKQTIIIDIGMKTTDYAIVEYDVEDDMVVPVKYGTIQDGLDSIYRPVIEELSEYGLTYTATTLDNLYHKGESITLENGDEFPVVEKVLERKQECITLLNAIQNDGVGKLSPYNKLMIGGGAKVIEDINATDDLTNLIDVDTETKYYANAEGYFEALA